MIPIWEVDPTYLLLDEFQHFVGPDLYDALPTVRQMGLRLILAHQSFSQLELGDLDLSGIIWQARSRLIFASDAEDADRLAHELATIDYDPRRIKEVLYTLRQRIAGHRKEWLRNTGRTSTTSEADDVQESSATNRHRGETRPPQALRPTPTTGEGETSTRGTSHKRARSDSESEGQGETLVPIHEDFYEISSKVYWSFDEERTSWAQKIRKRGTGAAFGKFRDDDQIYDLQIDHHPLPDSPALDAAVEELKARNFASDIFATKAELERTEEELRRRILSDPPSGPPRQLPSPPDAPPGDSFFR